MTDLYKDRRIGKFHIAKSVMWNSPDIYEAVTRDVVILDAKYEDWSDCFVYVGIHADFDETNPVDDPPTYEARITQNGDFIEVTWHRVPK